jgi:hypothetical protein
MKKIILILFLVLLIVPSALAYKHYCIRLSGGTVCMNSTTLYGDGWYALTNETGVGLETDPYYFSNPYSYVNGTPWTGMGYLTSVPAGYFNDIGNFTGTLTNSKYCTYNSGTGEIDCNSDGGSSDLSNYYNKSQVYNKSEIDLAGYVTGTPWTGMGYLTVESDPANY